MHSLKHFRVLHERNVFLTVESLDVPYADGRARVSGDEVVPGSWLVKLRGVFMESPDVVGALEQWAPYPDIVDPMRVTGFPSRETVVPGRREQGIGCWRSRLFAVIARNAGSVTNFFGIPGHRAVELGTRAQLWHAGYASAPRDPPGSRALPWRFAPTGKPWARFVSSTSSR